MNREEKVNSMIIGQRIKYARKSMNLTQEELGRLMCTDGKYKPSGKRKESSKPEKTCAIVQGFEMYV